MTCLFKKLQIIYLRAKNADGFLRGIDNLKGEV
jgi:hypothetical protein